MMPIHSNRGFAVVRLNALELTSLPSVCRRATCNIGRHAEVRSDIEAAEVTVLATRTQAGVPALGADNDERIAFSDNTIEEFDLHTAAETPIFSPRLILLTGTGFWQ